MLATLSASSARLSTASSMDSTSRPRSVVLKYLRQRIKELEQELENKRVQLFESEEARSELEARFEGYKTILTPESSSAESVVQSEDSSEDSSEGEQGSGAEERNEGAAQGEHRYANVQLIEHYQNVINVLVADHNEKVKELEENHRTEIELLRSGHDEAMNQQRDDHEVEHQAQAQEIEDLSRLYENRINISASILADKTKSHKAQLNNLRTESATIAHAIHHSTATVRHAAMSILETNISDMNAHATKLKALFGEEGEAAEPAVTVTSPGGSTDDVCIGEGPSSLSAADFERIVAEKQKKRMD